jgi:hypothetical protein
MWRIHAEYVLFLYNPCCNSWDLSFTSCFRNCTFCWVTFACSVERFLPRPPAHVLFILGALLVWLRCLPCCGEYASLYFEIMKWTVHQASSEIVLLWLSSLGWTPWMWSAQLTCLTVSWTPVDHVPSFLFSQFFRQILKRRIITLPLDGRHFVCSVNKRKALNSLVLLRKYRLALGCHTPLYLEK